MEVAHSANLVVLRTPPGSAHVVGSRSTAPGCPTCSAPSPATTRILVVCSEHAGGAAVAAELAGLAGL